jgi:hypothetical protein
MLRPAERAVADTQLDAVVTLARKALAGLDRHLFDDLDAVDLARELGQHRSLVAKAGADLENRAVLAHVEQVGHQGDDEWLRNGLAMPDRQRRVDVREGLHFRRYECVAWNLTHGPNHPVRQRGAAKLRREHRRFGHDLIDHVTPQRSEDVLTYHAFPALPTSGLLTSMRP